MSGASIEQTLDLWSAELGAVKAQIQPLFRHASVAASAAAFLDGRPVSCPWSSSTNIPHVAR